ncbi:MAG: response regulator [Syntrophales bacterium]|nr:response regulator [Syntrophales bacterium]MDD5532162.1 response regulator [Syntrophales bacterium]
MDNRKPRILCVDDEKANLLLLQAVLTPRGYDVVQARSGREALEAVQEQPIDLALLDVMMPEMDGYTVCRRIKSDSAKQYIPVVMVTALTSKQDKIRGIEAGAEDFISKPFDQQEVLARISMLLKMKEMFTRLQCAYLNINSLTSFGEELIGTFDPLRFDFLQKVDSIVNQIIRKSSDRIEKPLMVIVGARQEKEYQWLQYEASYRELNRVNLEARLGSFLPFIEKGKSKAFFSNGPDRAGLEIQPLLDKLRDLKIKVDNIVSYLSSDLCILALNYGRAVTTYDASVLNSMVLQSLFLRSLSNQIREVEDSFEYTVHALARSAEVNEDANHILRVGEFCAVIAELLQMDPEFIKSIRLQAALHDVGKLHIHPDILRKPDQLSPGEWRSMKLHPQYGTRIIGDHSRLKMAKDIALTHHENWDGSGYPSSLQGERIPVAGRIAAIADRYDALRSKSAHKPAFSHAQACKVLLEGDGRTRPTHFDPKVLKVFRALAPKFEEIYDKLKADRRRD